MTTCMNTLDPFIVTNPYGNLVDFVEEVNTGDVHSVALNHIDEVLCRGIVAQCDVSIVDFVLAQDCPHCVQV